MLPTKHNVIWGTPSVDASGSMPLGNGANGLNVWIEPNGDLCFYISRTDSWGEFGQLYKVGRVRVKLQASEGEPLLVGDRFRWELKLEDGAIEVSSEAGHARIWVDANKPVIQVLAEGPDSLTGSIAIEIWRKERRELTEKDERHSLHVGAPYPVYHDKDHNPEIEGDAIAWYHHNESSTWESNLKMQGLDRIIESETDPLLHRCFGGYISGPDLKKASDSQLISAAPSKKFEASIALHCAQHPDPKDWINEIKTLSEELPAASDQAAWDAHIAWWRAFWERSWIDADGSEAARKISSGYTLQRFMNACAGRGEYPIKFNGSIFTVDWNYDAMGFIGDEKYDADYRRWGPGYWHQNTRLPYWSMLYTGDFEMMRPYFEMYRKALPLATERVRKYCEHDGAIFTETMWFWGAYLEHNYGWPEVSGDGDKSNLERDPSLPGHICQNQYIRRHNSSGLEVVYHALLFYRFTGDESFLKETALPLAEAVIDYYDNQYQRKDGKLHISPAQVIEQWWDAENPLPEIAGLNACLKALLALPDSLCTRRSDWERLLSELPQIPVGTKDGETVFDPAETWEPKPTNQENPELYAVFPYHLCNLETEDVEIGINTFRKRTYTHDQGWAQDGMQAALLGLDSDARTSVTDRLTVPSAYARFPAFWGPSFDWIPDQDQGGSAAHALQLMVMQNIGDNIHPLPAWPESWSVDFKMAGPYGTTISGKKEIGQAVACTVSGDNADKIQIVS